MSKNEVPNSSDTPADVPKKHAGGSHDRMLTKNQQAFVREYVADMNGTQAAIRAGYAAKTARRMASKLLTLPHIQKALAEFREKLANSLEINPKRVLLEWARVAFANMADYVVVNENGEPVVDLSKCDRNQMAALSETSNEMIIEGKGKNARAVRKVKIRFHSKTAALEALSKNLGLFEADKKQGVQSLIEIMAIVMGESKDAK